MKHPKLRIVCASLALAATAASGPSEAEACTIGYAPPAAAYPLDGDADVPTNASLWVKGPEDGPTTVQLLDAATDAVLQNFTGSAPASEGNYLREYKASALSPQTTYKWRVADEVVTFTTGAGPADAVPPEPPLLAFRIDSFDPYNPQHGGPGLCGPNDAARVFHASFAWEVLPNTVGYRLYRTLDGSEEMLTQTAATWLHGVAPTDAAREGYYPYLDYFMYDNLDVFYDYELRAVSPTGVETAFTGSVPREVPAAKAPEDGAGCRAAPGSNGAGELPWLALAALALGLRQRGGRRTPAFAQH